MLAAASKALASVLLVVAPVLAQDEDETARYQPPRDYGHDWRAGAMFGLSPEDGLFLGGGPILYGFGFRAFPYVYRMELLGGIALKTGAFKVTYSAVFPAIGRRTTLDLGLHASELEVRNFYGFGNASVRNDDLEESDYYRVSSREYFVRPTLQHNVLPHVNIDVGIVFKHFQVREKPDRYVGEFDLDVLGNDRSFVGIGVSAVVDYRDRQIATSSGFYCSVSGWNFPDPFEDRNPFQRVAGDVRVYVSSNIVTDVTLALRVGGTKLFGSYPFYEAAYIGGAGSLRGYNRERFGGEAAAFGSAEVRFALGRIKILVPTEVGLLVLGDAGRVWLDGDSPGGWHSDAGGGIWFAPVSREFTFSFSVAGSVDGVFVNGGVGFGF